jgi:hypothetical protein
MVLNERRVGLSKWHDPWNFRGTRRRGNLLRTKTLKIEDLGQQTTHR